MSSNNIYDQSIIQKTTQTFINKAINVHGTRYGYNDVVYVNHHSKVKIQCTIHGYFLKTPTAHTYHRQGCPKCAYIQRGNVFRLTLDEFVKKADIVHSSVYDYTAAQYNGLQKNIKIICKTHGEFLQRAGDHLYKSAGCPSCGRESGSNSQRNTVVDFIEQARKVHGNLYDYSCVQYKNIHTKVEIICSSHGSFWCTPNKHISLSVGCKNCNLSKGELAIMKWLDAQCVPYIQQYTTPRCINPLTSRKLKFDFFIPDQNIAIEFDGIQHTAFIPQFHQTELNFLASQQRDHLKTEFCENNNINLVRIFSIKDINRMLTVNLINC